MTPVGPYVVDPLLTPNPYHPTGHQLARPPIRC
jgi:hypothetical protein